MLDFCHIETIKEKNQFLVNLPKILFTWLVSCVLAGQQGENRTTLVFFLGGVTYAEIAALRFLSQMEDSGMEYIIATTKLINGTTWIKSLMDRPESQNWDTCVHTWLHQTTHPSGKKSLSYCSYVHQWTAGVLLMSVLVKKTTGYLKVPCGVSFKHTKAMFTVNVTH